MTYTPKEWETGDIIGATNLNHIERGLESTSSAVSMVLPIALDESGEILDLTWQEIHDILGTRIMYCILSEPDGSITQTTPQIAVYIEDNQYIVALDNMIFTTDSADGYPSRTGE